jgi:hypothetical protein
MSYAMELIQGEKFEHYWPKIRDMMKLVPHTWEGTLTLEGTYLRGQDGGIQVWGIGTPDAIRMVVFSQIARHDAGTILEVFWGCGEGMLESGPIVDACMERFAQVCGAHRIDVVGRHGWEKIMAPYGYKKIAVVMSKAVSRGRMQ